MTSNTEPTLPNISTQKHDAATSPTYPDVLLVIPTLNEEEGIKDLLEEARTTGFTNILVVDGFSSDRTKELSLEAGARVVLQSFGKGKGCGVRTAMREFLQGIEELLCIIDGDGTNIPGFLQSMIAVAKSGGADIVLGSRTRGQREKGAMNLLSLASNLTVSFLLGARFRRFFTDIQTGYWLFTRPAVETIYPEINSTRFEIELEIFVKAMKAGLRVREIPVGFRRRKGHTKFSFALRMRNLYYAFRYLAS